MVRTSPAQGIPAPASHLDGCGELVVRHGKADGGSACGAQLKESGSGSRNSQIAALHKLSHLCNMFIQAESGMGKSHLLQGLPIRMHGAGQHMETPVTAFFRINQLAEQGFCCVAGIRTAVEINISFTSGRTVGCSLENCFLKGV